MNVQGPGGVVVQFPDGTDAATIDQVMRDATSGKADRLPMAAGAVLHDMPADAVQGGPTPEPPSIGSDISDVAASRYQAGLLDIVGGPGDIVDLTQTAGNALGRGISQLFGTSKEELARRDAAAAARGPALPWLPRSQDVKDYLGFKAYEPQTETGKTFNKWGGGAVELIPSVALTGGASILKKGAQEGLKAAVKKGTGDVLKQAVAPAVASEAAGEVTKGTPYEPAARLGAALVTGGVAGARRGKVTGALTQDQWRAAGQQAYADMRSAGVGVKPSSYDQMVNDAEQALHANNYRPALHPQVKTVLDELKASKGVPQSYEELDQMHRLAVGQTKSLDPDTRRVAGILADRIDSFMENLKPVDLISGGSPAAAYTALMKGRDAWRRMRTGEQIDNMVAKAKDAAGANYTAAGLQTALKQQFRAFKWTGKAQLTPAFKRLSNEEKMLVNAIISGNNALRLIGKFNIRNPVIAAIMAGLGVSGSPALAVGALGAGEAARAISAAGTARKTAQFGDLVRGGQWVPGRLGRPPNAVFYGTASQRETDRSK